MPRKHINRLSDVPHMEYDDIVSFTTPMGEYSYIVGRNHLSLRSAPRAAPGRNRAVLLEMLGIENTGSTAAIHRWAEQFFPEGTQQSENGDWPVVPTGLPLPSIEYLRRQVAAVYEWIEGIDGFVLPSDWRVDIDAINEDILDGVDYNAVLTKYAEKHGLFNPKGGYFPEYSRLMSHVGVQINNLPKPPR